MTVGSAVPSPVSRFVTANGVRLHYLDWGDSSRPAVLFLHGGSAHAHWWDFLIPQLVDRYRCIALDLRGHGDSGWPEPVDYRLESNAGDVAVVLDALGLRPVTVIGHSFGGFVAMAYARGADARLATLVIVDSRARVGERSARYMDALRKFPQPIYASIEEAIRRFRLLPTGSSADRKVIAHVVRHGVRARGDGTWTLKFDRRAMASTPPTDFSSAIAAVRCPMLAVRAEHSTIVSPAALDEFRLSNPAVELVEIADAHHHIMLDQPAALAAAIGSFLDRALAETGAQTRKPGAS
jgi:pimeloyl-ACP methyl ester carboxylesterase